MAAPRPLTSQHDWYIGSTLKATFNPPPDRTEAQLRISHQKGIPGWFTLPDADEATVDAPVGLLGERSGARTGRGKTLTYNLQLREPATADYLTLAEDMGDYAGAFDDRSSLGLMVLTPWEGLVEDPPETDIWAAYGQIREFDGDDLQAFGPNRLPSPWIREPLLVFRMADGRWLHWNESGTPGDAMSFGGIAASASVTNSGKAQAKPIITVASVATDSDVHIGRDAAGGYPEQSLWFLNLPAGTLVVDFNTRKATVGATDVTDHLDAPNSDWWDAGVPGIPAGTFNVWRGPGAGGNITVELFSARWS